MVTFAAMRIAVYAPTLFSAQRSVLKRFIVQTLGLIFQTYTEHSFFLLGDVGGTHSFPGNVEFYKIKKQSQSPIGKKIWWDIILPKTLNRLKADLFISFDDRCSLTTPVPQVLMSLDHEKVTRPSLVKARSILVLSKSVRNFISEKYNSENEKIFSIHPFSDPAFRPIDESQKEKIKETYSGGKEFFLHNGSTNKKDHIELLKAFSLFKKRQQSNLKLVVIGEPNEEIEKDLSNYKYREDVVCIDFIERNKIADITASAYAVILPFNSFSDVFDALNAMQAGSPLITTKNSDLHDIAGESVLLAETGSPKDISEKMMRIYINESLRSMLIEKGKLIANEYLLEKAVEQMWQAFMKALN